MAYIKFKELSKYFNFKKAVEEDNLPEYVKEYVNDNEKILLGYKNNKDYALFTNKRMILFDRDVMAVRYKKIHMFPYSSISTSAVCFKPGKAELLFSFDSGYQLHINFIDMHHKEKEQLKVIYKIMMDAKLK